MSSNANMRGRILPDGTIQRVVASPNDFSSPLSGAPDWWAAEVESVQQGARPMGARMRDKLTGYDIGRLLRSRLHVLVIEHGPEEELTEYVWARSALRLKKYLTLQHQARSREISLPGYWAETGQMFGYSPENVADFTAWQDNAEEACSCPQCRPMEVERCPETGYYPRWEIYS